jgi:hypothetical protein
VLKDPLGVIPGNVWEHGNADPVDRDALVPTDERFNPALFVAKVHENTSLSDLQNGISALKHERDLKDRQVRSLVLDNIHEFVHCRDTIEQIRSMVERGHVASDNGSPQRRSGSAGERMAGGEGVRSGLGLVHHVRARIEDLQVMMRKFTNFENIYQICW